MAPQRAVADWWHVDTMASVSHIETFAIAFETASGSKRLRPAAQTPNRPNPPALAPDDRPQDGDDDGGGLHLPVLPGAGAGGGIEAKAFTSSKSPPLANAV